MGITIEPLELLALKKLAILNGALAESLNNASAKREQRTLLKVLVDVISRGELDQAKRRITEPSTAVGKEG